MNIHYIQIALPKCLPKEISCSQQNTRVQILLFFQIKIVEMINKIKKFNPPPQILISKSTG